MRRDRFASCRTTSRPTSPRRSYGTWRRIRVSVDAGEVVGFLVVERRSERAAEILWIAVRAADRGSGMGTALLERVIAELAADGLAEWNPVRDGDIELRLSTGEAFLLGNTSVSRIA